LRERLWGGANQADLNHGRILTVLAGVETELRLYQQAEKRFEEALRIWNSIPGSQQGPEFGAYLNNLGMLRYGQGKYLEAERCLREAVTIFEQLVPRYERRLAQSMAHLAGTLSRLKLHTEADALSNETLARFRNRLPQDPLLDSELLSVRAFVLRNAKRGREAKQFEALARDLQRKTGALYVTDVSRLGLLDR
jgi:tetratricopeptide (TPR) repeat protein